jgi:predicted enzyme related to lactoylglutathione lyase
VIGNHGRSNGGIVPSDAGPPNWMPYFGHEDVDRLVAEIDGLGGRVLAGVRQVPAGRFAVLGDPQGAVFAVLTGRYDD